MPMAPGPGSPPLGGALARLSSASIVAGNPHEVALERRPAYAANAQQEVDHTELEQDPENDVILVEYAVAGGTSVEQQVTRTSNVLLDFKSLKKLDRQRQRELLERVMETQDQDNMRLMQKVAERLERAGLSFPGVEVRWQGLRVEADLPVGGTQLPSLTNALWGMARGAVAPLGICTDKQQSVRHTILNGVSGVLRPGRMCLLLGPPGSGKTTLMKALAHQLHKQYKDVHISGTVTYNGKAPDADFVPARAAAYVSQHDVHIPEMTVSETLSFASECLGPGASKQLHDMVREREKALGIEPDPHLDALWMATFTQRRRNVIVEMYAKLLGIDHVMDTVVGDDLLKGISGGQKRRVTSGEMAVGLASVMFMDEISNGLDSASTLLITKALRNLAVYANSTILISLLQPPPEVYGLFDDVMVISHGRIVYLGPREDVMPFFSSLGLQPPLTKTDPDFLQEVTTSSDQHKYWTKGGQQEWAWIPPRALLQAFEGSPPGQELAQRLASPPHEHPLQGMVLRKDSYALSWWGMMRTTLWREALLLKRNKHFLLATGGQLAIVSFIVATTFTLTSKDTIDDANLFLSVIFFSLITQFMGGFHGVPTYVKRLMVVFKQRDHHFYAPLVFAINGSIFRMPEILVGASVWSLIVYFSVGYTMEAGRFFIYWLNMVVTATFSTSLFNLFAAVMRSEVLAQGLGSCSLMLSTLASGFPIARGSIPGWWIWLYWISPMSWIFRSLAINELTSDDWSASAEPAGGQPGQTLGDYALEMRGFYTDFKWVWIGIGVQIGTTLLLIVLQAVALTYLPPPSGDKPPPETDEQQLEEEVEEALQLEARARAKLPIGASTRSLMRAISGLGRTPSQPQQQRSQVGLSAGSGAAAATTMAAEAAMHASGGGGSSHGGSHPDLAVQVNTELKFEPMVLAFKGVKYFVPKPKGEGELQLLDGVDGVFRPGVLTALMGASGAGKTTLMDVLAGRKTGGRAEGVQALNGHPKVMAAFSRVCGYVEQFDVHNPQSTVLEALLFSAQLRLPPGLLPDRATLRGFVGGVMDVVELRPLAGAMVGWAGSGLSTEARKRLTIAVELVANPSIVFMDEPTSGLDARAAAVVMRAVRNTVNTGRTVVCTIHQPNREIVQAFDELLLLKPGGRVIFNGPLGRDQANLTQHLSTVSPQVPRYEPHVNPANWMLDVTSPAAERRLQVDFAEAWAKSQQAQATQRLVEQCCTPAEGVHAVTFVSHHAVSPLRQLTLVGQRALVTYWRNPSYNVLRLLITLSMGLLVGTMYWDQGMKRSDLVGVLNIMGALFCSVIFMGISNSIIIMPVVTGDRVVYYRERASGMYGALPFVVSQGLAELPYLIGQSVLYCIITYFCIHFEFDVAKFFWYLLYFWLGLMAFTYFGMAAANLAPHVQLASAGSSLFLMLWNLFCGFLIYKKDIPGWWIWAYYLNPATYTIYGCVVTQLGDVDTLIKIGDAEMPVSQYVRDTFGYKYEFRGWLVLILVAFVVGFRAASAYGLTFLNFQKR